ncbi:MAG: hypothetical protein ACYTAN_08235 [Planctomycetota bacterium]|jgi:hypothetical protein
MSAAVVLVPVMTAVPWGAVAAAVLGAAANLGYTVAKEGMSGPRRETAAGVAADDARPKKVEVPVKNTHLALEDLSGIRELTLSREGMTVRLRRKKDGTCVVCADGPGRSKAELQAAADEVAGRLIQQLVYNKVVTELKGHDFEIVDQQVDEDRRIRIRVSRWVS